jgi:uncharacterized membrane protein YbhN (UPF0104 family)
MRVRKLANQLIITSHALKGKSFAYWVKAFLATFLSWTGRYWVVNFIFMAFFFNHLNLFDHLLVYARQLTMWIILLVSPTPGGSGIAEFIFSDCLGSAISAALALNNLLSLFIYWLIFNSWLAKTRFPSRNQIQGC